MYFSKSKYTAFRGCPKCCWLDKYKREEKEENESVKSLYEKGHEVGDLAKGLFGKYEDMTTYKADGSLDLVAMAEKTKDALARGVENICEAAFMFGGLYCAVDILHKEGGGYAIYEVKSSTMVKDYHYADAAYQAYVVSHCGVTLTGVHVVVLNKKYVRHGELNVSELFSVDGGKDISKYIADESAKIEATLAEAEKVMASKEEADISIGRQCGDWCGYWRYCTRNLPKPNVFDLYNFRHKWECYDSGIVSFEDVLANRVPLNEIQGRQVDFALNDRGTHVNQTAIRAFLSSLTYPLCFLDFETMQIAVPQFDGTKPYEQIPFQYSLHIVEREDGEAEHREFLAESGIDPRRALAEKLCEEMPQNACTLAYHAGTERGIIEKLAEKFPDLSVRLLNIANGIVDLLPVFQKGYYYKREMGGSFSVKSVLPAVFPELDYHNLDGVQNGTEAMDIFPQIASMPPEEAQKVRKQLLEYCKRDTLAMVKLWQELIRVSK